MNPTPSNERGFFESPVIRELNDDLLALGGSSWADWRRFNPARIDAVAGRALRARAREALAAEFGAGGIPVLKDPRMCRLMGFWTPVFADAGWSVRVALPVRSPLEVACSLERRDGTPVSLGCLIWLRHVLDAEADSRGMVRAIIDWSRFLADWRAELGLAAERLRLSPPRASESDLDAVGSFLSKDLRHFDPGVAESCANAAVSDLAREVYAQMLHLADDPDDASARSRLDALRGRFEAASALFNPALRGMEDEVLLLRGRLANAERVVADVTERRADRSRSSVFSFARRRSPLEVIRNSAFFASAHYLETNPDVRAAGLDPAAHYLAHGGREGRDPGPHFSTTAYLARNPDVAAAGLNALVHYETCGRKEKRPILG